MKKEIDMNHFDIFEGGIKEISIFLKQNEKKS